MCFIFCVAEFVLVILYLFLQVSETIIAFLKTVLRFWYHGFASPLKRIENRFYSGINDLFLEKLTCFCEPCGKVLILM